MKGRGFLRVTGILMIIGGAVTIIMCGALAMVYSIITSIEMGLGVNISGFFLNNAYVIITSILFIVGGIIELITGIIGTASAGKPEKYKTCLVWGIIVLAIQVISIILTVIGGAPDYISLAAAIIFGIIIPILFIIGAILNRRAALAGATSIGWKREKLNKQMIRLDKQEQRFTKKQNKIQAHMEKREAKEAEKAAKLQAKQEAEAQKEAIRKQAEEARANAESVAPVVNTEAGNTFGASENVLEDLSGGVKSDAVDILTDTTSQTENVISDASSQADDIFKN